MGGHFSQAAQFIRTLLVSQTIFSIHKMYFKIYLTVRQALVYDGVMAIRSEIRKQKRIPDLVRSKTVFLTITSNDSSPTIGVQ